MSRVAETKLVCSGMLFNCTCAPLTKRLPLTVILNEPGASVAGVTELIVGIRLRTVTVLAAKDVGLAALVALIVAI